MSETRIDTFRQFETPEGVQLDLRVASAAPRALAWVLDLLVRMVLLMMVGTFAGIAGEGIGEAVILISLFVISWLYHVVSEVLWNGATIGKRSMGLRVVHTDGTPIGWGPSMTRNLLRVGDQFPMFSFLFTEAFYALPIPTYGVGLVMMLLDERNQRLGDKVAGTLVVYNERKPRADRKPLEVEPFAPPLPLRPEERRALLEFAERRSTWTIERQIEMTDLLAPVTGATGKVGRGRVLGLIAWLEDAP